MSDVTVILKPLLEGELKAENIEKSIKELKDKYDQ